MKKGTLVLIMATILGCGEVATSEGQAKHTAEAMGWTDVQVTARHGVAPGLYGCSKGDVVAYEIQGTNPAKQRTTATVCCGWPFKSCTMRVP